MNHADKIEVAGSGMKNRYRTIIPSMPCLIYEFDALNSADLAVSDEHTRVKLPEIHNDPVSSYINANYIRVSFLSYNTRVES